MTQPPAPPKAEAERLEHTARIVRMLNGCWEEDARTRLREFYHSTVVDIIGDASIARNPLKWLAVQLSGILDLPPIVRVDGRDAQEIEELTRAVLFPMIAGQQEMLVSAHELVIVLRYTAEGGLSYQVCDPTVLIDARGQKTAPDQPGHAPHQRMVMRPDGSGEECLREVWDINVDPPTFTCEAWREVRGVAQWVDVRSEYWPDVEGYPHIDRSGKPIMPIVLMHDRIDTRLWHARVGSEIVAGTLDTSALHSWWLTGARDGSSPVRVFADGVPMAQETSPGTLGSNVVVVTPGTMMPFKSVGEGTIQFHQFAPAIDMAAYNESLDKFVHGLAIFSGLSPGDFEIKGAQSGYAIALSRDGQRRIQRRMAPAIQRSIQVILATAARLLNVYQGTDWPEDPEAYKVVCQGVPKTPDEIKADTEAATVQRAAGVLSPVDHLRAARPEFADESDEACLAYLIAAKRQEALLASIGAPQPTTNPPPPREATEDERADDPATAEPPEPDEPADGEPDD